MANAIEVLAKADTGVHDFIGWCRATIRYMLMFCGTAVGEADPAMVDQIMEAIVMEVAAERNSMKQAAGTAAQLEPEDLQAVVYHLIATLAARSAKLTNGVQVNQTIEQFANLIVEAAMQAPGKAEAVELSLASIKATCPPLGQVVAIKLDLRRSAMRDAQIAADRKLGIIGRVGQALPGAEVEAKV